MLTRFPPFSRGQVEDVGRVEEDAREERACFGASGENHFVASAVVAAGLTADALGTARDEAPGAGHTPL